MRTANVLVLGLMNKTSMFNVPLNDSDDVDSLVFLSLLNLLFEILTVLQSQIHSPFNTKNILLYCVYV